jgi:hypothetical protein
MRGRAQRPDVVSPGSPQVGVAQEIGGDADLVRGGVDQLHDGEDPEQMRPDSAAERLPGARPDLDPDRFAAHELARTAEPEASAYAAGSAIGPCNQLHGGPVGVRASGQAPERATGEPAPLAGIGCTYGALLTCSCHRPPESPAACAATDRAPPRPACRRCSIASRSSERHDHGERASLNAATRVAGSAFLPALDRAGATQHDHAGVPRCTIQPPLTREDQV